MIKPFYMLSGQIDLVKETKSFKRNGKRYVEKTYVDENGNRAVVMVPSKTPPKRVVSSIGKDGESQQDLKDALQRRMKPMPDTGIRIGPAGEETNIYAAGIRARKQMRKPRPRRRVRM